MRILQEYDDYSETYKFKTDYFTYYRDSNEWKAPVYEKDLTNDLPVGGGLADMEAERIKKQINEDVENGDYPGFWVHHISIEVVAGERQRDADYYTGRSYINDDMTECESEELDLPEDWDAENPDYLYLADEAYNYED